MPDTEIRIRFAAASDAAAIARVHVESWRVAYAEIMGPRQKEWISFAREKRRSAQLIADPATPVLVAESATGVLGFLVYGPPVDKEILALPASTQIYTFFVHPDNYRKGIGTRLLLEMQRETDARTITVWVMTGTTHGPQFYKRSGFSCEPGTEKFFQLVDREFPIVRFRKDRPET